ncbi:YihY/virulence factor BrkB family protein [Desulfopila inferna]|uniref:YihY/virulence factor BrkB family protein n=1 Tax=Desulfopila inferna TaxID=468528 RepID=UPI00196351AF|nr:YihY/virulence factor BrkB family protein [Desulfopila inferna]MBM9606058.1 YihY/virulence factor BrkB family protein [Desulfopila inferna]
MSKENRGRGARRPGNIPWQGWKDILLRTKEDLGKDNLSIVAAGVAFYALLAIFPAIGAMVAIYGLVSNPGEVQQQVSTLSGILPQEGMKILQNQLERVAEGAGGGVSFGALIGILFSLGSATKGMKAFITGLNIVYGEEESRGFIALNVLALLLTFGAIIFVLISLGFIVVFPILLKYIGLSGMAGTLTSILRWPLLAFFVIMGLGLLYRYAPHRNQAQFKWINWGAIIATLLWIAVSILFSLYVSHSDSYNEMYGSIGAIIILLMWFYITAFAVLLGAEINAEMELQTQTDTTHGPSKPLGERGAYVADTVGKSPTKKTGKRKN